MPLLHTFYVSNIMVPLVMTNGLNEPASSKTWGQKISFTLKMEVADYHHYLQPLITTMESGKLNQ